MFGSNNAQSGGLFGSKPAGLAPSQPAAPSGGLFGGNTSNTNSGGLLGSNTNNNSSGGGLFGSNNTANSSTGASGGLFGNKPSGGLFGGNTSNTTNSTGGGLFGNNTNNTQNNTTTNTGGGLFGNNASSNTSTGGLFGGNNTSNNTTNATNGGGLFGGNNTNNNQSTGGGLFGNKTTTTTGGGLFGGNNTNNTTNTNNSGGGLFGGIGGGLGQQQQQQQQQQQPQQQQQQLTAMSRVGDLPPAIKQELEQFDKYINTQHLIATTLQADVSKHDALIDTIPKDISYLHNKLLSTRQALRFDTSQLANLKLLNTELTEDINKILQLILQLSTPGTRLSSSFQLNEFFVKKIKKYHDILNQYESLVTELDLVLNGLERSCRDGFGNLFSIVQVIKSQYSLFMELCETMAQLHNEVNKVLK